MRWLLSLVLLTQFMAVSAAQPLPQPADLWEEIGIPFDPAEPGWNRTAEPSVGYDLTLYEKGKWAVSFFPDGQLASATNWAMWDAAARKARSGKLGAIAIASEPQAYARAKEFRLGSSLWREGSQNDHCTMGVTSPAPLGHNALLDGKCEVAFIAPMQGVTPVEGGRVTVVLDRFNGTVVDLLVEHTLHVPPDSAAITAEQARASAIAYVQGGPALLSPEQRDAMLVALPTAPFSLAYVRRPIAGSPWRGVLVYQSIAAGVGVEVHAVDSGVLLFPTRGGHSPGQSQAKHAEKPVSGAGTVIAVGMAAVAALMIVQKVRRSQRFPGARH
jgi:hypothetical protein